MFKLVISKKRGDKDHTMGEYDFTYEMPKTFDKRVVQFLEQIGRRNLAEAFLRCEKEYEDIDFAYYAGIKGDNWNKRAIDFTLEGLKEDILLLKSADAVVKEAIAKALKSSESGYLVRNICYFESDIELGKIVLPSSNEARLNADIETAQNVLGDIIQIGERVCLNPMFNSDTPENNINDLFRDMLFMKGYIETKDQTRHGISLSGKNAGEVDILLARNGKEIAIFEGLKLDSIKASYIDEHIKKAIINYNALGTATFIVTYVSNENFEAFWNRYFKYIKNFGFSLQEKTELCVLPHPNATTRLATQILSRDGYDFPVYFIAFKIQ